MFNLEFANMDLELEAEALLATECRFYMACTGAGAGLQSKLWDVPGISKVLVGAEFPYDSIATDKYLGYKPTSYCSSRTAVELALESYYRAYEPGKGLPVGLGLTASVASNTAHRGDHRVHVATVTNHCCRLFSAVLHKNVGAAQRKLDGWLCDALGLYALREATSDHWEPEGTAAGLPGLFQSFTQADASGEAMSLLLERPFFTATGKRTTAPTNGNGLVLFPGAFNPPHEGHLWMAREYSGTFHLTVNPPHKEGLSVAQVLQRAKLLEGYDRMFTRDDPLYIDKARRFPGAKFMVGVDAIERMLDPKWGPNVASMLDEFRKLGIKFLVADREVDGRLLTLGNIPGVPMDICERIARPQSHLSMSSTKVREMAASA